MSAPKIRLTDKHAECKTMVREYSCETSESRSWNWSCKCGRYGGRAFFLSQEECLQDAREHAGTSPIAEGPRVITHKSTVGVPRGETQKELKERWVWHASNEGEEGESFFCGTGRTELEAIENLESLNEARRWERSHLREGYKAGDWLDFQAWG